MVCGMYIHNQKEQGNALVIFHRCFFMPKIIISAVHDTGKEIFMRINELEKRVGMEAELLVYVSEVITSQNKSGNKRLILTVNDSTGKTSFNVWEENIRPEYLSMADNVCLVKGKVDSYNGKTGMSVTYMSVAESYEPEDFFPVLSAEAKEKAINQLKFFVNMVRNASYRALLNEVFFGSHGVLNHFLQLPAGVKFHHSFNGGLLIHTLEVCAVAVSMTNIMNSFSVAKDYYSTPDSDLVITGALLHDLGKVREYEPLPKTKRLKQGALVGHLGEAVSLLTCYNSRLEKSLQVSDLSGLMHCIMASHGSEGGMVPATKEALIIWKADESTALMDGFDCTFKEYDKEHPGNTEDAVYSQWLGTRIYRTEREE